MPPKPIVADSRPPDALRLAGIDGTSMDRRVPGRGSRRLLLVVVGIACLVLVAAVPAWYAIPHGLLVHLSDVETSVVARGVFRDEIIVRSTAEPIVSVLLDATEGGRVEAVFVRDGALLRKDDPLFRLSNPQRQQELLARESDVAQQVSNLATLRVALESSRAEYDRRIADLEFEVARAAKSHARTTQLAEKGFVSAATLEESQDKLDQQRKLLAQSKSAMRAELAIKQKALADMGSSLSSLERGFKLMQQSIAALSVNAPADGQLTDFRLKQGESVKVGDRLGRIDAPGGFKLVARVNEFYLARTTTGLKVNAAIDGQHYQLTVVAVDPQVKDGYFRVELQFDGKAPPRLKAGQGVDARLALGAASEALMVPDAAFLADTGGKWAYVVSADGKTAERRDLRVGRRAAGQVEILEGLAAGEKIIISSYSGFGAAPRLRLE